jgi:hypothetical protein
MTQSASDMSQKTCLLLIILSISGLACALRHDPEGGGAEAVEARHNPQLDVLSTLRVEVRDQDTERLVPARLYLADEKGKRWAPPGMITYDKGEEHHFISPGSFTIRLPAGKYTLIAERGPEYHSRSASIDLPAGQDRKETLALKRWIRMNGLGFYSGDLHNHRNVQEMPALLLAEDLNLAPTLADWIWEDRPVSRPPQTSEAIREVDTAHAYSVLDKEVERLESGPGAVALVGLKSAIPFQGYRLYPPNSAYCEAAHAQGGYVDAEKIVWRDVAALVALNQIDFAGLVHNHFNRHNVELETDRWGMIPKDRPEFSTIAGMPLWSMEVYYRFLNCGFRLPVSGGSASGVKASPLGYNRVYVRLADSFSYPRWFEGLKAGHSFATNGPMLFLTVNGKEPGSMLRFSGGKTEKLSIRAEAISAGSLDRLEIISKGHVIKTVISPRRSGRLVADFESSFNETGWLLARCFEQPGSTIRFAHTSPIYLQFGDGDSIVTEDVRFFLNWMDREIAYYENQPGCKAPEHREEMLLFFRRAKAVYSKLVRD